MVQEPEASEYNSADCQTAPFLRRRAELLAIVIVVEESCILWHTSCGSSRMAVNFPDWDSHQNLKHVTWGSSSTPSGEPRGRVNRSVVDGVGSFFASKQKGIASPLPPKESPLHYLGYVAIALSIAPKTNRTCRLRHATPELLRKLIRLNLQDLLTVLQFNLQNHVFLYRISSQIIPFASHPVNRIAWWDEDADLFDQMAQFIAQHRFRVSMHPGQFTVLNALRHEVVAASVDELRWHARFLQSLGTDARHKIVVHVGGIYNDKRAAADRFVRVVNGLPETLRRRLAVENDERAFSVEDVLDIASRTGIPVAFDWLHHKVNPGHNQNVTELVARCFDTWGPEDGLPEVHFSTQAVPGRIGQHADWIDAAEFEAFLRLVPDREFDCMLEAKKKELALFRLRSELSEHGITPAHSSSCSTGG